MSAPSKPAAGDARDPRGTEDPPPFLRRWPNVYLLVLGELGVLVAVFYVITWWAS